MNTFDTWFETLSSIAKKHDFPLADKESYRQDYDEWLTPNEVLNNEASYG